MLETVDAVIDAVGGSAAAASLGGVKAPAVSNWKARGGIPSELYLIFRDELARFGHAARPAVFGLKEPVETEARP